MPFGLQRKSPPGHGDQESLGDREIRDIASQIMVGHDLIRSTSSGAPAPCLRIRVSPGAPPLTLKTHLYPPGLDAERERLPAVKPPPRPGAWGLPEAE